MKSGWMIASLIVGWSLVARAADPMALRQFGADNPAVIYVFTSPTCPHCSRYHQVVLPKLRSRFVDTGKAQIRIVDMPYDRLAIRAVQLGRCMDMPAYEAFMAAVHANQSEWRNARNPKAKLKNYAALAGLSAVAQERCLATPKLVDRIKEQRDNLSDLYRVNAMPVTVLDKGREPLILKGTDVDIIVSEVAKELAKP